MSTRRFLKGLQSLGTGEVVPQLLELCCSSSRKIAWRRTLTRFLLPLISSMPSSIPSPTSEGSSSTRAKSDYRHHKCVLHQPITVGGGAWV